MGNRFHTRPVPNLPRNPYLVEHWKCYSFQIPLLDTICHNTPVSQIEHICIAISSTQYPTFQKFSQLNILYCNIQTTISTFWKDIACNWPTTYQFLTSTFTPEAMPQLPALDIVVNMETYLILNQEFTTFFYILEKDLINNENLIVQQENHINTLTTTNEVWQ